MHLSIDSIINGQNALLQTGDNIEEAASYCAENYLNSKNQRRMAIDGTTNYATQSLGTMIHQINLLASNFLKLLDQQTETVSELAESMDRLGMEVNIHKEKAARKAIGSCTVSKTPINYVHTKIRQEPFQEYIRRPIDYSILDNLGHGTKSQNARNRKQSEPVFCQYGVSTMPTQGMSRRGSTTSHPMFVYGLPDRQNATIGCKTLGPKSESEYAESSIGENVPDRFQGGGTLGRTAGIYRTGVLPSQHLLASMAPYSGQVAYQLELGGSSVRRTSPSNYAGSACSQATSTPAPLVYGHSRRSSSSSGRPALLHIPQTQNYAPAQPLQPQEYVFTARLPTGVHREPVGLTLLPHHVQSPDSLQQADLPLRHFESETADSSAHNSIPRHHYPNQYQPAPYSDPLNTMEEDLSKMNLGEMPLPPPPMTPDPEESTSDVLSQTPTVAPKLTPTEQPYNSANLHHSAFVDISQLQPSPLDHLRPRQSNDPPWAPQKYIQKVVTVYEYTADKSDELSFGENELIFVIKKNDDGWWEGVMRDRTGLFPGNYVEGVD